MQTAFRHFIGPSMPRLTSRSFSEALASYVRLFTEVRGRRILGSPHSPGPTPMGVPDWARLPSAIIETSSASS